MKRRTRFISFLLILAMVLGLMPLPFDAGGQVLTVKAEDLPISGTCGDNSTWTLTEDTEVVNWDLQGTPYKLTIEGTGVISDVSDLYPYLDTITSISIEEGITGLEEGFFSYPSLKSVTFPSSFIEIPEYAFAYDPLLQTIEFGNQLTKIGVQAFTNCYSLESVTFPDSLTTIEGCAFQNCTALKSVTFSENLATIGERAFEDCYKLEELTFPDSLTTIGESAFEDCGSLLYVICGKGLKVIEKTGFYNTAICQIEFKEGLEEIGESAFEHCGNLFSVTLPDSLTTIKSKAFSMSALTDFTIPKNVSAIGEGIFYDSSDLKTIQVADGNANFLAEDNILYEKGESGAPYQVKAYAIASPGAAISIADGTEIIDRYAFYRAKNITTVVFPDTLREIKEEAFFECKGLEELSIPDNVESLGDRSFYGCSSINKVSIGAGLQNFGLRVFFGCNALQTIEIAEDNMYLDAVDNIIYDKGHTHLYYYMFTKGDQTYHIPDTVESISGYAIAGTSALKELYMPPNLNSIAGNAINANANLDSIYFLSDAPGSVSGNSISGNASDLLIFRRPSSSGWDVSPWTSYRLADWEPENLTVEEGNFGDIYWKYKADEGRLSFTGSGELPDFTSDSPAPWSEYMGAIQTVEADALSSLGDLSFCQAERLIRVETNGGLKKVGSHAFAGCGSLCFLDLSALEDIGSGTFEDNVSLGNIALEKTRSVGSGAFKGCTAITEVAFGNSLTTLEEGAFTGCTAITGVTFGVSLTSLEKEVFAGCTALNNIIVPDSVSAIKDGAFKGCASLRTINIPAGVLEIGNAAFSEDAKLEKVYFYGGIPEKWEDDSFTGCSGSLTIYYRRPQGDWEGLGGVWNGIPVQGQDKFYTERRDHYSFVNASWSFGYESGYQIPRQRYVDVMKSIATGTYHYVTKGEWGGSCYGMVATTLEFYENPDYKVEDYDESAQSLYDIAAPEEENAPLTKLIEAYQVSQYECGIASCHGCVRRNMHDYKGLVRKVEEFERSGGLGVDTQAEPVIMVIFAAYSGHAVIPVSVDRDSAGDYVMKVYDPNSPGQLNTLKINRNFSGMSYGMYTYASYVPYSLAANAMSGVQLHSDTKDDSLYLSIDKEKGRVTDAQGKGLEEIEGAYEQKPFNGTEEDVFSGIKSFVLPQGNYQLTAKDETEASEESVTFYLATEDNYVKVVSSDEDAVLDVQEENTQGDGLKIGLQSDSQEEETLSFTIMNDLGMERTVDVEAGNATVKVAEDDTITIEAPVGEKVSIDGKEIEMNNGQAVSSFVAAQGENPLRVEDIETSVECGTDNRLNGAASATVIANVSSARKATITADYYEVHSGKKAATYSQEVQLNAGMNMESLSLQGVETDFSETEGSVPMICKLTVSDKEGNSVVGTVEGITVTLTKKTDPTDPTEPTDPTDPTEPTDPTDPTEPTDPDKPNPEDPVLLTGTVTVSSSRTGDVSYPGDVLTVRITQGNNSGEFSYQWYANGNKIEGATKDAYLLSATDIGKKMTVEVTSSVETGKITGNYEGSVIAKPIKATGISLSVNSKKMYAYQTLQLKAAVIPLEASQNVEYVSDKRNIADVSESGKITAKAPGTAKITVRAKDGSGISAVCTITVQKPVIKVSGKTSVKRKKTITLTAKTYGLKGTVKWKLDARGRKLFKLNKSKGNKVKLTAKKKTGKAKLTITCGKKKVTKIIRVKK